jgi:DNA-binding protein WhiA
VASFCIEQKEEIMAQLPKSSCCRRALLYGIIAVRGECDQNEITVGLDNARLADAVCLLVGEFFGKRCVFLPKAKGGRSVFVFFESPSCARFIREIVSSHSMNPLPKCHACAPCFLQGIFVACGRISDPQKQYCLELLPKTREKALLNYLSRIGIEVKRTERSGAPVLYLKNSGAIEDFFALAMMNATAFRMMNAKIESDIRNTANRVANCETNNIEKAVAASSRQIAAIEELAKKGLLSSLSEELEKTARLRLEHRDLSLTQLAALCVPPITKPGLSHRLNKIVSIADRMLADVK